MDDLGKAKGPSESDDLDGIDELEIEPLSDEALEAVAGGKSSDGNNCCSCDGCSNPKPPE